MDKKIQPKPLTGEKLVQKINQLGNYSKEEKAKVCGYYSVTKDNQTQVNLPKFYDAILEAKGVTLEPMSFGHFHFRAPTSGGRTLRLNVANNVENQTSIFPRNTDLNIVQKGNRIIAFASGGAFLGGLIAQVPGAIAGAIIVAIYATFVKTPTDQP